MIIADPARRRVAAMSARVGAGISAAALAVTASVALFGASSEAAPVNGGPAELVTTTSPVEVLDEGGSATPFRLRLPEDAACTGDTATDNYLVQSYMVPATIEPSSLTFDASNGAIVPEAEFGAWLYSTNQVAFDNEATAPNPAASGRPQPGIVIGIPGFNYEIWPAGFIPAGEYNIGIACTLGTAGPTQLDKFWNARIEIVDDETDQPAQLRWTVLQDPGETTTTIAGGSTTATTAGATTTTTAGATTTTRAGATTTTTAGATTSTTTTSFGGAPTGSGPSVAAVTHSAAAIPVTGSTTTDLVFWSVLLLIFGRMAVLLARPPRVRVVA